MKQPRRARYDGLTHELAIRALADDFDELEGLFDEHADEDEEAFRLSAEQYQEWRLTSLKSQNRTYLAIIMLLITVIASIVVPLVTR